MTPCQAYHMLVTNAQACPYAKDRQITPLTYSTSCLLPSYAGLQKKLEDSPTSVGVMPVVWT